MTKKDYYKILGIPQNASNQAIKQGYRAKAMECHPDRGGTHEAMLSINEAYEILINPVTRQHYDDARTNVNNQASQQQAWQEAAQAQDRAQEYPRKWSDFENWIKSDFTDATYYQTRGGQLRVDNSASGGLFMIIGGIAGIVVFVIVCIMTTGRLLGGSTIWLTCGAGVGVGAWMHKQIGDSMRKPGQQQSKEPNPESASPSQRVIIGCPKCQQQLRAPATNALIRCPKCQLEFRA